MSDLALKKRAIIRTPLTRVLFFLIGDSLLIVASVYLSFLLRFDGEIPLEYFPVIQKFALLAVIFLLPIFFFEKLYSFTWAYISASELIALFKATSLGFLFLAIALYLSKDFPFFLGFPRSTLFISYFLVFIFCGALRFSKRAYSHFFKQELGKASRSRTLIVGAGDAGEQMLRSILSAPASIYLPIGFVDDDQMKQGVIIHGLKVLGKISEIPKIVSQFKIEEVIIALPSAGAEAIKKTMEASRRAGIKKIKLVPSLSEIINGQAALGNIRVVQVEDLLTRDRVLIETKAIESFIRGKVVLITGAAGSIGSEICRQALQFNPCLLVLLDQDETGIFNLRKELEDKFPRQKIKAFVADINDGAKTERIFAETKPQIIFHAAAYKHVPLMEEQPEEAVKNNIFGTKTVAEAALKFGAEKLIFISTDKSVNPSSVMGASKRIGEELCQALNQRNHTKFISVRFGNVLDSRGSVIPLFKEQIKRGGPVEVTHPEMKRYFMLNAEAVLLVMQAAAFGQGGEVFVLDMGEPIKIVDLAREMIRFSGFEPDRDIPIVFIGIRPGEKLFEEILTAEEGTIATENRKIFRARLSNVNPVKLESCLEELKTAAEKGEQEKIIALFKELLPTYKQT